MGAWRPGIARAAMLLGSLVALSCPALIAGCRVREADNGRVIIEVRSTVDGTKQRCALIVPRSLKRGSRPAPLLVSLHTWKGDYTQRNAELEEAAARRGWIYLFPDFRGPNNRPEACGSPEAQQDVLDAVAWARKRYPVDVSRIYLAGVSGGGHMAMLMAARHGARFAAVSAWVGISDLAAWHATHARKEYGRDLRRVCGGPPGAGPEVDRQYRERSPLTRLGKPLQVPLDLAAGVNDGHTGSVPIRHTLDAFNAVAGASGSARVSEAEIEQLSRASGRLHHPLPGDEAPDPDFRRRIYLSRQAGLARVTVFEGGHEMLAEAAAKWLERQEVRTDGRAQD